MLQQLHRKNAVEFSIAAGFGPQRMISMHYLALQRIPLPEPELIPLPAAPPGAQSFQELDSIPAALQAEHKAGMKASPSRATLMTTHIKGAAEFFDPGRIGYARDRSYVIGFEPHAFVKAMPAINAGDTSITEWRVTTLQLVSLLKHDSPRVYVSDHLPNMKELTDVPTRELTQFEQWALPQIRQDDDLIVEESSNRILMLGSLRADVSCLRCHSVRRGELLGAFSYILHPESGFRE